MQRDLPELHGAEQRKTMGNLFARGMWGNFGRHPKTGAARSPEMQALMNDPWVYRDSERLAALSPHAKALPKPKGPGLLGYLGGAVGGAAGGAGLYYAMGGTAGFDKLGFGPPTDASRLKKATNILQKANKKNPAKLMGGGIAQQLSIT